MEMESDEQRMVPISSSSTSNSYGEDKTAYGWLRRVVGATAAAVVVGGPLLVVMGITMAVTLSLTVIGFPIMVICSPLLIIPTFILVTCIAGFSLAAVMALAGISTLNWVFRSIRHRLYIHGHHQYGAGKAEDNMMTKEEDGGVYAAAAAEYLQQKQQRDDEEEEEEEEETVGNKDGYKESEEGILEKPKEDVTPDDATPSTAATATDADTTEKKQQAQKVKKTKTPKKNDCTGRKQLWFCGFLQYLSLYGAAVAYVITTSISIRAIQKSNCYHKEGHQASCSYGDGIYMLLFGCAQIIMSQIPDFHNMKWLSILAAVMSFAYSTIGLALGFATVIGNRAIKGSISGVPASSTLKKLSLSFQAIGDIAFAYPYAIIVLEIQDTLKSPPPENQTMKKASMAAVLITTFFYLSCGCFGYAAFGNDTPGNILTGFGFYEPYWLIDFANACIVVHLVGGYQVYSQPVFAFVERGLAKKFPNSGFVNDFHSVKLPLLGTDVQVSLLRLCFRTAYVASTTGIAMIFPFFNQVLGLLGAIGFWPLAIYFPVEMYIVQKKMNVWTTKGILLRTFSVICLLVSVVALVGSVEGLVSAKLE